LQIRKFRLNRASLQDTAWLRDVLDRESRRLGAGVAADRDDTLSVTWR
jgi:poly-gamma-glutamate synthesis protein (capsule biosynthesis protein)